MIAKDGWPLPQPFMCDTLIVGPGERWDVLVEATEVNPSEDRRWPSPTSGVRERRSSRGTAYSTSFGGSLEKCPVVCPTTAWRVVPCPVRGSQGIFYSSATAFW